MLVLFGDSTLDNIVWVQQESSCIASILRSRYEVDVVNLAADGFTSHDVLNGAARVISAQARRNTADHVVFEDGRFSPLSVLDGVEDRASRVAVLSVGGNDVREVLMRLDLLEERLSQFVGNYPRIVARLRSSCRGVILCTQYRPSCVQNNYRVYEAMEMIQPGVSGLKTLGALMRRVYEPSLFQQAIQHGLPVIDLTRSMDPSDPELFVSQIEPSAKGGEIIARLVHHVLNTHPFGQHCPRVYYSEGLDGPLFTEELSADWSWDLSKHECD